MTTEEINEIEVFDSILLSPEPNEEEGFSGGESPKTDDEEVDA